MAERALRPVVLRGKLMVAQVGREPQTVGAIMSRGIISVHPLAPVSAVWGLLTARRIQHLVVMEDEQIVGVVCTCNLERRRSDTPMSRCMSTDVVTIDATA